MPLRVLFNDGEDQFPLPAAARRRYGPFGFPAQPAGRPYLSSNFVQSLDGVVSYRDLPGRTTARDISHNREDRWIAQMLRAHHDALLLGAGTLREERGPDGRGWDYGHLDAPWRAYRKRVLGRERSLVVVATASGELDLGGRLFAAPATETWILTTPEGERRLRRQAPPPVPTRVASLGRGRLLAPAAILRWMGQQGLRRVLCESGPTLYAQFFSAGLVDEEFRTVALTVAGVAVNPAKARPSAYDQLSYRPETAPWQRLVSVHAALPFHLFLRLRREKRRG